MKHFETKKLFETKQAMPVHKQSLEEDVRAELNEYEEAFRQSRIKEQKQTEEVLNSGFWFCAYFADFEQCQEFLTNAGLQNKMCGQYINGEMMADIMGVKLTKKKIKPPKSFRRHKDFTSL